jgi:hypothetical protein
MAFDGARAADDVAADAHLVGEGVAEGGEPAGVEGEG